MGAIVAYPLACAFVIFLINQPLLLKMIAVYTLF